MYCFDVIFICRLNKSASAFDELGKKLNRLPSFHRAITSASITSLTSMHSHSIHLSKSFENAKLTNGPSLHSIRSLRTPTGAALLRFDTNTESMHSSMHSNIYPINITPITHPATSMLPKGSISPSLPSISDKGCINISHTESIIQFAYVELFVVAFPLTPLLAIVNSIIEMKIATNFVKTSQRPNPNGLYGLGSWKGIRIF